MDFRQRPVTVRISTHTLARRVTFTLLSSPQQHHHFNPHPRTEGDPQLEIAQAVTDTFQPTPSHGG